MCAAEPNPYRPSRCGVAGERQRAVADQAAAQQRRRLLVGELVGQRQAEALVGDGQLGVAAVDVAAGEAGVDAQVLAPAGAVAGTSRRSSRATARRRGARPRCVADDLVAEDHRQLGRLDLVVAQVQIGAADRAGPDRQQQLAVGPGSGSGSVAALQRLALASSTIARIADIVALPLAFGRAAMVPLNVPNVLTVIRILLVPVLVVALLEKTSGGDLLAAIVFAVASLTDAIDGYLARSRNSVTTFGKLMDPIADKLLIIAALVALVSLGRLEAWVAMVIIAREFAVTVLRVAAGTAAGRRDLGEPAGEAQDRVPGGDGDRADRGPRPTRCGSTC